MPNKPFQGAATAAAELRRYAAQAYITRVAIQMEFGL